LTTETPPPRPPPKINSSTNFDGRQEMLNLKWSAQHPTIIIERWDARSASHLLTLKKPLSSVLVRGEGLEHYMFCTGVASRFVFRFTPDSLRHAPPLQVPSRKPSSWLAPLQFASLIVRGEGLEPPTFPV